MTREEAIKWMEETMGLLDKCFPALKEEVLEQNEVFKIAISALRSAPQPGKPLTLDQLRVRWKGCDSCKAACWNCSHNLLCCEDNDKECHYCFDQSMWEYNNYRDYCPDCGRPLTDEAWAELEQRLQGMPLPEPPEEG